jgi:hypothetical protein
MSILAECQPFVRHGLEETRAKPPCGLSNNNMWRATQGRPADELLKKGDFILHLPFWNSFPWEVNSFPELQNIKSRELFIASESKSLFSCAASFIKESLPLL